MGRIVGFAASIIRPIGKGRSDGGQVDSTAQALDYLRESEIAAENLNAFGNENVLLLSGRSRYCSRAGR